MSIKSNRPAVKRPVKDRTYSRSPKSGVHSTEWELTDDRLDEALRQTFPASDALSMIRNVRDN
jgi:hypothetical protein